MYRALFRNWKFAALWAVGISASIGAFFGEGGGHEQFEQSAQQIREKRHPRDGKTAEPGTLIPPPPAATQSSGPEPEEPEFGQPEADPGVEGETPESQGPGAPTEAEPL